MKQEFSNWFQQHKAAGTFIIACLAVFFIIVSINATTIGTNISTSGDLTVTNGLTVDVTSGSYSTSTATGYFKVSTSTATTLYVDGVVGKVGVGTTSPDATFEVYSTAPGSVSGDITSQEYPLRVHSKPRVGSGEYNVIEIRMDRSGSSNRLGNLAFSTEDTAGAFYTLSQVGVVPTIAAGNSMAGALVFRTKEAGQNIGDTEALRITSSDFLGVSSSTPWARLSVEQGTSEEHVFAVGDQGTSTPSFIVNANARVGIGTSTPARLVEIAATDEYRTLRLTSSHTVGSVIDFNPTATGGIIWEIGSMANGSAQGGGKFAIVGDGPGTRLVIDSNGNIGFGTSNPGATLHVSNGTYDPLYVSATSGKVALFDTQFQDGYGVSIATTTNITQDLVVGSPTGGKKGAGTINAQAVYDDNTQINAPDYVFDDPEYEHRSIEEVEAFISKEAHLPWVTGRDDLPKEHPSLGQRLNTVLEAVENMMLYVIELAKKIVGIEEKIDTNNQKLEQRIQLLERRIQKLEENRSHK